MDNGAFFLVVDGSRQQTSEEPESFRLALSARLAALSDAELEAMRERHEALYQALCRIEVEGRDLHDLVLDNHGYCSEDSFIYFCEWVLWQGRVAFEAICRDPVAFLEEYGVETYEGAISYVVSDEERRREEEPSLLAAPGKDPWPLRGEAEQRLANGTLPSDWQTHDDPYVRALAWLAHPPEPDPALSLASWPERAAVYLRAAHSVKPEQLEALSALLLLDAHAPARALYYPLREALSSQLGAAMTPYKALLRAPQEGGLEGRVPEELLSVRRWLRNEPEGDSPRHRLDAPLAVLSCRLDAIAGEGPLSVHDPLSLPGSLARGEPWSGAAPFASHPLAPLVLCSLLRRPRYWLHDRQDRHATPTQRARDLAGFSRALVEHIVTLCGGSRSVSREEVELLAAVEARPRDQALRAVYSDYCQQAGVAPRSPELLAALRDAYGRQGVLDQGYVAGALAELGDPLGLEALARAGKLH